MFNFGEDAGICHLPVASLKELHFPRLILKFPDLTYGLISSHSVRGVSQIKFTMYDSFLVLYDFDILSMIKRKNPFGFYCAILILNLSRLISLITILISKVCRVWFLKWHFWFPKFIAFDFSNNTFDFQNLSRLISQMTLSISKIYRVWFLKWRFRFPKFVVFDFSLKKKITLSISKMRQIWMIFTQQFCGW